MSAPSGRLVPDAIGRVPRFEHCTELPVLGIPVTYETNDVRVLDMIEQTFGRWRQLASEAREADGCRVRIVVEPGEEEGEHAHLRYRVGEDGYVLLTTTSSAGYADPLRREARAWVTDTLLADVQHFRYGVLEALTIALLSRLDRQPFHAAAIVHDGAALLLAGPSGVGKSTLAYAAARAGFAVLAEDVVYVQREPHLRVWGSSPFLHLSPESVRFFPELATAGTVQLANGKKKLVIDLGQSGRAGTPFADLAGVCILHRGAASAPVLRALSPGSVAKALTAGIEPGFDLFPDTTASLHDRLAAGGGWNLTVGGAPSDHIPVLRRMLEELIARP